MREPIPSQIISEIRDLIHDSQQIVIVPHFNPDGDAIGSTMGLYNYLSAYKKVNLIAPNAFAPNLQWMNGADKISFLPDHETAIKEIFSRADLIFCLDFSTISRMDVLTKYVTESKAKKVVIDHHPQPEAFSDYLISDTTVSSTCELVFEFISVLDRQWISKDVADCLFTGILTDTGSFNHNASNPRTYQIVGELLAYGADKERVTQNIFANYTENRMRLMGYVLNEKLIVLHDQKTAYAWLTKEELQRFNYQTGDSEGFVNMALSIKGIVFSAFFMEAEDRIRISFRSKGTFDVNKLARAHFNGGGHVNAAGGRTTMSLNETLDKFRTVLPDFQDQLLVSN